MSRLLIAFVILLGGCTSISEYYSPEVEWSDWTTVGSCGNKFEIFKREVSDGITLEMIGPYFYLFRLNQGKTIQLKSNIVKVTNSDTGDSTDIAIKNIKTGVFFDDFYRNLYRDIKERHFGPLELFQGTGNYQQIEMNWGEWSAIKGKRDIFRIKLEEPNFESHATLEIDFPLFLAQGIPVDIKPITFKWKRGRTLACVQ